MPKGDYTGIRGWSAEGARVGIVTCKRCGAALLIDPGDDFDVCDLHDVFHDAPKTWSSENSLHGCDSSDPCGTEPCAGPRKDGDE
jgi:hypothetical protein